jgi:prepilin-type N-terminal cleavage/methylation domain-containing protein
MEQKQLIATEREIQMNRYPFPQTKRANPRMHRGFTLLEFILTIAILSFIIGMLGAAFRFSIRCWERGEKDIEEFREVRIVLDRIAQQLKSVYPYWLKNGEKWGLAFAGETESLTFVSPVSLKSPVIRGLRVVHYRIEQDRNTGNGKNLVISESQVLDEDSVHQSTNVNKEERQEVLLSGLEDATFEFYDVPPEAQEGNWLSSWYGGGDEDDPKLPQAIRIKLKQRQNNGEGGQPITTAMTIPLSVSPDKEGVASQGRNLPLSSVQAGGGTPFASPSGSPSPFPQQGGDTPKSSIPSNQPGRRQGTGNQGAVNTPFGTLPAPVNGGARDTQSTPFNQ